MTQGLNHQIDVDLQELLAEQELLLKQVQYKQNYCKQDNFFTDEGTTARSLYPKHLEFFAAGFSYKFRLFLAANRIGKTTAAAFEVACHLTGIYPIWWVGKRYDSPRDWWVCGKTTDKIKELLEPILLGDPKDPGTGMIPRDCLDLDSIKNVEALETKIKSFRVKHITGGWCNVTFKSYAEGRDSFEGEECCIWLDEEPPEDVYTECATRTATNDCMLMITFTPLEGITNFLKTFTVNGDWKQGPKGVGRYLIHATWDDCPHITKEAQQILLSTYPEHERDARAKGIPMLGTGAVYPKHDHIFIDAIQIPDHWTRAYSIDFGQEDPTAILWGAIDPETNVVYFYAESYLRNTPAAVHASIIIERNKAAGFKLPGVCDPSGGGRSQIDGQKTRDYYTKAYDLTFEGAINSIEPGIAKIVDMINADQIKVFKTLTHFKDEMSLYRRLNGKLMGDDHLMDCLRYFVMSAIPLAKSRTSSTTKDFYLNSINKRRGPSTESIIFG